VLMFGAPRLKPRSRLGPNRPGPAICRRGLAMRSTEAFLFGFTAASMPILIYGAWIVWRIAEAI
jgi:hypothetical protein